MKTISVRELSHAGASRAIAAAESEPVLVTKSNEPAAWIVSAEQIARVVQRLDGNDAVYRATLTVVAADLFDRGLISIGRAAQFAGMPLADFILTCGKLRIPILRQSSEELEAELTAMGAALDRREMPALNDG